MTQGRFFLLMFGLLAVCLILAAWADKAFPVTLKLAFHAPARNADNGAVCGLPDSAFTNPDGTLNLGTPLTDLGEIRIYGYRFSDMDTTLIGTIPAVGREGDSIAVDLEILPGTMGVFYATAVDTNGNEACIGAQYLFALPAIDPQAAKAIEQNYEILWRRR